jgi:hypothetical protein
MPRTSSPFPSPLRAVLCLLAALLLAACQSPAPASRNGSGGEGASRGGSTAPALLPRSLAGHWEKDYRLSDDFNSRLALYVADIQRRYSASGANNNGFLPPVYGEAINGLARFAEELTRMPTLAIEQEPDWVSIERDQDFPLWCRHGPDLVDSGRNAFGADACGWNGQRLIFSMQLAGGLSITHQFSLSGDGEMLDLTTTVSSDVVASPLTIRNLYRRYSPPAEPDCMLTLTRSRVCSQRGFNR